MRQFWLVVSLEALGRVCDGGTYRVTRDAIPTDAELDPEQEPYLSEDRAFLHLPMRSATFGAEGSSARLATSGPEAQFPALHPHLTQVQPARGAEAHASGPRLVAGVAPGRRGMLPGRPLPGTPGGPPATEGVPEGSPMGPAPDRAPATSEGPSRAGLESFPTGGTGPATVRSEVDESGPRA
jgi:hypothetical protein